MLRTKAKDGTSNSKIPINEQHSALIQCKFYIQKLGSSADIVSLFYKEAAMFLSSFSITLAQNSSYA